MTDTCRDYGTAAVQLVEGEPRWLHSDEHIHVAPELLAETGAIAFIETRYAIAEPCPEPGGNTHAHLKARAVSRKEPGGVSGCHDPGCHALECDAEAHPPGCAECQKIWGSICERPWPGPEGCER